MAVEDKVLGATFMAIATMVFCYYTCWTLILPFVDKGHPFQSFFPDRYYAVVLPMTLLATGVSGIVALIGLVMIKSSKGKKILPKETKKAQ